MRNPTQTSWHGMIDRCYNQNIPNYRHYGGRGVKVCEYLRASPNNLRDLLGDRPNNREISLDRIDTYGNYSCGACAECLSRTWPLNVRWSNRVTQNRNQRDLTYVTLNGETKCLSEWAEEFGLARSTVSARYIRGARGMALFAPPSKRGTSVIINGDMDTIANWPKRLGIDECEFRSRLKKYGARDKRTIST
jgi:hypothetical protein